MKTQEEVQNRIKELNEEIDSLTNKALDYRLENKTALSRTCFRKITYLEHQVKTLEWVITGVIENDPEGDYEV